jgi:hypothetical protein
MTELDPTIRAQVQELLERKRIEYDPTTIKRVSTLPPIENGLEVLPIGTILSDVIWVVKKGWHVVEVLISKWEVVVFVSAVLGLAGLPHAADFVETVQSGDLQQLADYFPASDERSSQWQAGERVQLPDDMKLVSGQLEMPMNRDILAIAVAPSTTRPDTSVNRAVAAAGLLPTGVSVTDILSVGLDDFVSVERLGPDGRPIEWPPKQA